MYKPFINECLSSALHIRSKSTETKRCLLFGASLAPYNLKCIGHIWIWPKDHRRGSSRWYRSEISTFQTRPILMLIGADSSYRTIAHYFDLFWGHVLFSDPAICLYWPFISFLTIFWMGLVQKLKQIWVIKILGLMTKLRYKILSNITLIINCGQTVDQHSYVYQRCVNSSSTFEPLINR